jgi:hypothetical protein
VHGRPRARVNQMSIIFLEAICSSRTTEVGELCRAPPSPATYLVQCLENKNSTLYTILKFIVRVIVFIEISTLNPTSGAIMSRKFITTNLIQRDPIMTSSQTYILFNLFISFRTGGRGLDLYGSEYRHFVLVTSTQEVTGVT